MSTRRWVLVVVAGGGPLEDVHVYGPWRSRARADKARERLARAVDGPDVLADPIFDVCYLDPENGPHDSLADYLRRVRAGRLT